jgi:hypothetical protein
VCDTVHTATTGPSLSFDMYRTNGSMARCAACGKALYVLEMNPNQFPAALHAEVAQALHYHASSRGAAPEDVRLVAVRKAVCRHAHTAHMTPEGMVIAIGRAFEGVACYSHAGDVALRFAYDRLVTNCVKEYSPAKISPAEAS